MRKGRKPEKSQPEVDENGNTIEPEDKEFKELQRLSLNADQEIECSSETDGINKSQTTIELNKSEVKRKEMKNKGTYKSAEKVTTITLFHQLVEKIQVQRQAEAELYNSEFDFQKHLFPHLMSDQSAVEPALDTSDKGHTNRSKPLLEEVRQKLKETYEKDPSLYYEHDLNNAMSNDWYLKRYLLACRRNVHQTVQMVLGSFALRKKEGFRDHGWDYFPNEAHSLGAIFTYAPDKEGNITLYMRIRVVFKDEVLQKIIKLYAGKNDGQVDLASNECQSNAFFLHYLV
jgi:hypothetical protein